MKWRNTHEYKHSSCILVDLIQNYDIARANFNIMVHVWLGRGGWGVGVGRISLDSNVILTSDLEYKLQNKNDPE